MASVNPLSRELVFKIVYYGPGLGGKTTTLEYLHRTAKPEHRGKLVSLATPVDRTLYFDFLPVRLPPIRGMNVRLQLFTVPGQVYFNATRKLVLTGADGIVFVSDSQAVRADANLESLENLRENLAEQGRELAQMPLVFQHNKRDLPDLLSNEELDEMLNPFDAVSLATSAKTGIGVYEGLERISERVLRAFEQRLPDEIGGFGTSFDAVEGGLVTALRDASPPLPLEPAVSRLMSSGSSWSSIPPDSTLGDPELDAMPPEKPLPASEVDPDLLPLGLDTRPPEESGPEDSYEQEEDFAQRSFAERGFTEHGFAERDFSEHGFADTPSSTLPDEIHQPLAPPVRDPGAAPAPGRAGISFAMLWAPPDRELVSEVETAIAAGRYTHAVLRCDTLVSRILANAADLIGSQASRDPAVVLLLLRLDGRRYLGFRGVILRTRTGGKVTTREALEALAFAIDARLAEAAL